MCLLCLGGDKSINHFNAFLLPPRAGAGGPAGTGVAPGPARAQGATAAAPLKAFTTAAVMGLAQAPRTPTEQRALVTTMSTLSGLVASAATAPDAK
jgi:hypothetical protein